MVKILSLLLLFLFLDMKLLELKCLLLGHNFLNINITVWNMVLELKEFTDWLCNNIGPINIATRSVSVTKDIIVWHRMLYENTQNTKLKE